MSVVTIGVSFKAYFDRAHASAWCAEVASGIAGRGAVADGAVHLLVIPTHLQIEDVLRAFAGTPVGVGAQDVSRFPVGPYTGETTAAELAERGVRYAEIGHAERRQLLGETDDVVAAKAAAALAVGLTPVLCLGETEHVRPAVAAEMVLEQLAVDLAAAPAGPVVLAYEPVWAIGAPGPAPDEHITTVIRVLRETLDATPDRAGSAVIYGGSAGPGLLSRLGADVDGLFLGRFAHDPAAFLAVIDEAAALAARVPS